MKRTLSIFALLIILGYGAWSLSQHSATSNKTYESRDYGVRFVYPASYYLKERTDVGTQERPQLAVVLVSNTKENVDIIEGRSTTASEGPTAITLDVHQNPNGLDAKMWAEHDTNWMISSRTLVPITVGGKSGVMFTWDGLYQGKTIIVTTATKAYVFANTTLSPEDPIGADFARLLQSVKFAE